MAGEYSKRVSPTFSTQQTEHLAVGPVGFVQASAKNRVGLETGGSMAQKLIETEMAKRRLPSAKKQPGRLSASGIWLREWVRRRAAWRHSVPPSSGCPARRMPDTYRWHPRPALLSTSPRRRCGG